jgi:signal transduction histidine kinase
MTKGTHRDPSPEAEEPARGRLEEVERYYKSLFSMVSHDIRAPLGVILGALGEMPPESETDPERAVLLRLVHRSAARLSHYAANILELSRLDAGRFHLRPVPVCVHALARQALDETRMVEAGASIDIVEHLAPAPLDAYLDPDRFRQIITNLLANAHRQARRVVTLGLQVEGDRVRLEVTGDGRVLPSEDLSALFDQARVVGDGRASGLELVLASRLVAEHGGTLRAESMGEAGGGAGIRFVVELPQWHHPAT